MPKQLFIAFNSEDEWTLASLKTVLKPILRQTRTELVCIPDVTTVNLAWLATLEGYVMSAKVCVLLVSDDFLTSDLTKVLLPMVKEAAARGTTVMWVPVSPSFVSRTGIYKYQAAIDPARPLSTLSSPEYKATMIKIAEHIRSGLEAGKPRGARAGAAKKAKPARAADAPVAERAAEPAPAASAGEHTFICYAREDSEFVLALASDLKAAGVNVWLDQWDIPSGADWDYEIDKALDDCRHFLIVLSPEAVNSEEVRSELRTALNERKRIVPVLYKACRIPRRLTLIQYTDFTPAGPGRAAALKQIEQALGLKKP